MTFETTLTYSNMPALGVTYGASGAVTAATWTQVDVTSAVAGYNTYDFALDLDQFHRDELQQSDRRHPAPTGRRDRKGGGRQCQPRCRSKDQRT